MQLFSRATNERLRRTAIVVFLFSAVALAVPINPESNSHELSRHLSTSASLSPVPVYRDIVSRAEKDSDDLPTYEQAMAYRGDTTGANSVSSPGAVGAGAASSSGAVGAGAAPSSGAVGAGAAPSSGAVGAGAAPSSGAVGAGAAPSSGAVGAGAAPSSGVVGAGPASSSTTSFKIVAYVTCDSTYDSSRKEEPAKKALCKRAPTRIYNWTSRDRTYI